MNEDKIIDLQAQGLEKIFELTGKVIRLSTPIFVGVASGLIINQFDVEGELFKKDEIKLYRHVSHQVSSEFDELITFEYKEKEDLDKSDITVFSDFIKNNDYFQRTITKYDLNIEDIVYVIESIRSENLENLLPYLEEISVELQKSKNAMDDNSYYIEGDLNYIDFSDIRVEELETNIEHMIEMMVGILISVGIARFYDSLRCMSHYNRREYYAYKLNSIGRTVANLRKIRRDIEKEKTKIKEIK